ncbi:hypothetical protein [Allohahella marinimesophila]|uniref:Uncharacterized protein n=1 Tax=Allohahella marinimesophila TaxID=1054972 RepID=A0ABP7PCX7_9GAMM
MELPPDFLNKLDDEAKASFLQDMVLRTSEADAYGGDLDKDCARLERDIRAGHTIVSFDAESETFALLARA